MSNGVYGEDFAKCGVTRKTQDTNVLLVHAELGKVSCSRPIAQKLFEANRT